MDRTERIALSKIVVNAANPRDRMGDEKLGSDLCRSIEGVGLLEPLVVRIEDSDGKHRLIDGHRRFACCLALELFEVLCHVVDSPASDAELILTANTQRRDLTLLQEVDLVEKAIVVEIATKVGPKADLVHDYAAELQSIMGVLGRTEAWVSKRLRISRMPKSVLKLWKDKKLSDRGLLMVAELPTGALQDEAAGLIAADDWNPEGPPDHSVKEITHRLFHTMKDAPFDLTDVKLGQPPRSCVECPERTGTKEVALFDDFATGDNCTNHTCWQAKSDKHVNQVAEKLRSEGKKVLTAEEAKKHVQGGNVRYSSDYVNVDDALSAHIETKSRGKLKPLIRKSNCPTVHIPTETGQVIEVAKRSDVAHAMAQGGAKLSKQAARDMAGDDRAKRTADEKRIERMRKAHWEELRLMTLVLGDDFAKKSGLLLKVFSLEQLRVIAGEVADQGWSDVAKKVCTMLTIPNAKKEGWPHVLQKYTADAKAEDCIKIIFGMLVMRHGPTQSGKRSPRMDGWVKHFHYDFDKGQKEAFKRLAAPKVKRESKAAKKKAALEKKSL